MPTSGCRSLRCSRYSAIFAIVPARPPPFAWQVGEESRAGYRRHDCHARNRECIASRALVVLFFINMIQHPYYHHAPLYEKVVSSRLTFSPGAQITKRAGWAGAPRCC